MTEGNPMPDAQYKKCYVAFLDILGFKTLVGRSKTDAGVLPALILALNTVATIPPTIHEQREVRYECGKCVGVGNESRWITQIRYLSDCVVAFIPIETHALSDILCKVRYLHDRLLELGFCVRGALTIGDMYWDDAWSCPQDATPPTIGTPLPKQSARLLYNRQAPSHATITLGPALVEAYELERQVVFYPRVVFSASLMSHIDAMATATPIDSTQGIHKGAHAGFLCSPCTENHTRCVRDFIRTDSDGMPFFDLFHWDIVRNDTERIEKDSSRGGETTVRIVRDEMTSEQFMRSTRGTIERLMSECHPDNVRVKYLWLANYFDASVSQRNIEPLRVQWGIHA